MVLFPSYWLLLSLPCPQPRHHKQPSPHTGELVMLLLGQHYLELSTEPNSDNQKERGSSLTVPGGNLDRLLKVK